MAGPKFIGYIPTIIEGYRDIDGGTVLIKEIGI